MPSACCANCRKTPPRRRRLRRPVSARCWRRLSIVGAVLGRWTTTVRISKLVLAVAALIALPAGAYAAPAGLDALIAMPTGHGAVSYTVPIQILLFMTGLVFLPAVLLAMTSFTRIIIVLSLLRQALGLTQTPPNQILIGLALFLTMFVMAPVFNQVNTAAL